MIIIKRYRLFTGVLRLLSQDTYSNFKLLNYTAMNFRPCIKVYSSSAIQYNKYKNETNPNMQKNTYSLLKIENISAHVKSVSLQQNRYLSIAAKLVNNASPKVQPYMKLMRIDKPTGKT